MPAGAALPHNIPGLLPQPHLLPCPTPVITQGGCEDEHQRMDYMARDKFYAAHNEDQ